MELDIRVVLVNAEVQRKASSDSFHQANDESERSLPALGRSPLASQRTRPASASSPDHPPHHFRALDHHRPDNAR